MIIPSHIGQILSRLPDVFLTFRMDYQTDGLYRHPPVTWWQSIGKATTTCSALLS